MHGEGYFAPMQIAPALRHAFRFVSLSAVVFTIAFAVPSLFGEDIDPRDYIGEDISKYPPHLRQQIERAFLRETGERFTGSQYDPRSPNYAFKNKRDHGGYNSKIPDAPAGPVDHFQRAMLENAPRVRIDYSNETNAVTTIAEDFLIKEQRKREHAKREEDLKYKEKILEEKTLELELKKIERELEKIKNSSNTENEKQYETDDAK